MQQVLIGNIDNPLLFRRGLAAGLVVLATLFLPAAAEGRILTNVPENRAWKLGRRPDLLAFDAESGREPVLILNKSALAAGPMEISLGTDAKSLNFMSGRERFEIRLLPARGHRLRLDGRAERPTVQFDGNQILLVDRSRWARMMRDESEPTVVVLFKRATRVALQFSQGREKVRLSPPGRGPATNPTAPKTPAGGTTTPGGTGAPLPDSLSPGQLAQVHRGVFQILVPTPTPGVSRTAPAFLVSRSGYAITSFHALRGAVSATVRFNPHVEPVPVELWAVKPSLDLALVRLPAQALTGSVPLAPLELETAPTQPRQKVWAVGPAGFGSATVANGRVLLLGGERRLATALARSVNITSGADWLVTSVAVDHQSAGGPLVNAAGRVVGAAAWSWSAVGTGDRTTVAVSAAEIRALAEAPAASPLTFKRARGEYSTAVSPQLAFPRLVAQRTASASQLRTSTNSFRSVAVCQMCKGLGHTLQRVRIGSQRGSGSASRPIYENRPTTCKRCGGNGIESQQRLPATAAGLARVAALVNRQDPALPTAFAHLRQAVGDIMKNNAGRLSALLNQSAQNLLQDPTTAPGTPVLLVGRLDPALGLTGAGANTRLVSFLSTSNRVLVRDAGLVDDSAQAGVLIGGLLAGHIRDTRGKLLPVIQHGMIVALPSVDPRRR